jgi:mRNA interferase YafQ
MKQIMRTNGFERGLKRIKKRGYRLHKLEVIIDLVAADLALPQRCRPHKLVGNYEGLWVCHIEPDWLLIYETLVDEIILIATGTHADLFQ